MEFDFVCRKLRKVMIESKEGDVIIQIVSNLAIRF